MEKNYKMSLFIFRRDLRLYDNTALLEALKKSAHVIPCFIFDPKQVDDSNKYRSLNAIQFMRQSLLELEQELKKLKGTLFLLYGEPQMVLEDIVKHHPIEAVFVNKDYTPYSAARDSNLQQLCSKHGIDFLSYNDALLVDPATLKTKQNKFYTVFTPFYKRALDLPVAQPVANTFLNYFRGDLKTKFLVKSAELKSQEWFKYTNPLIFRKGGRHEGLEILKNISSLKEYSKTRDTPALPTTGLSAHNKFGTVSIREVYHDFLKLFGKESTIVRELYWRDFFTYIAYHFPFVFGSAFHKEFNTITWNKNSTDFERWCTGTTGFPIVDAGMRQMNTIGWMHNRARLIVGSFLVKDLHINWQTGERYFATNLVDYDPSVNNGNWQWVASTGCDAQPYFRIFNPWLQQKRFDPECVYIKTWIPELKNSPVKDIHTWYKNYKLSTGYPAPMVDHALETGKAQQVFRVIKRNKKVNAP